MPSLDLLLQLPHFLLLLLSFLFFPALRSYAHSDLSLRLFGLYAIRIITRDITPARVCVKTTYTFLLACFFFLRM